MKVRVEQPPGDNLGQLKLSAMFDSDHVIAVKERAGFRVPVVTVFVVLDTGETIETVTPLDAVLKMIGWA